MGLGSIVGLVLNVLFALILVIGFLLGIWRGLKKSAVSAAFSIVGVLIAFFVTPPITNAILGISVNFGGTSQTINEYLMNQISSNPDIANLVENSPSLESLIASLPSAIANVVVFIVVTLAVELVLYIPYRIIASVCLKQKGQKKYRWWGGAVGVVKAFLVALLVFMPLSSLSGTVSEALTQEAVFVEKKDDDKSTFAEGEMQEEQNQEGDKQEESQQENSTILAEVLPAEVIDAISAVNSSAFGVLGGAVGLDNAMFDYLSKVDMENGNVYIRQELVNYFDAYNIFTQISNEMQKENGKSLTQLNFEKIDKVIEGVLNGGLYRSVAVEVLTEVIVDYQNYSFMQNETFVEYYPLFDSVGLSLKTNLSQNIEGAIQYFSNDIKEVYSAFKTLATNGVLDQMRNLSEEESILDILTTKENVESLTIVVDDLFSMNMVRDSVTFVANKMLSSLIEGVDEIAVDVKDWTEEKWDQLSSDISSVFEKAVKVIDQVEISQVLEDPTSILQDKQLNISSLLSNLGGLIDGVRSIELFKNAEGNSILDQMLVEYGFTLPAEDEQIYNANGELVKISSYTDLLNLFVPSFEKLQKIDLFTKLENSTDAKSLITYLAGEISKDNALLSTVILPLTQVEPAKSLITDLFAESVNSDLISIDANSYTYSDWKSELDSLTQILTTLNKKSSVEGKTYLDLALDGDVSSILSNLGSDVTITDILSPVLTAQSTDGLKRQVFQTIDEMLNEVVGTSENFGNLESLDFDTIFIKEGGIEDQTDEVCKIFESVIEIYKDYTKTTESGLEYSLSNMDKTQLGVLADRIKENAYRVDIASQSAEQEKPANDGIFRVAFDNLYNKMLSSFENGNIRQLIEGKEVYNISFTSLMASVEAFEDVAQSEFVGKVSEILTSEEDITIEKVEELVDTISQESADEILVVADTLLDNLDSLDVKIELPEVSEEELDNVLAGLDNNTTITENYPELKDKIKDIFNFLA